MATKSWCLRAISTGALFTLLLGSATAVSGQGQPGRPAALPQVSVTLSMGPYLDHSVSIIGIKKGWFKEAGITIKPEPNGKILLPDETHSALLSGSVNVANAFDVEYAAQLRTTSVPKMWAYVDLFQGYAISCPSTMKSVRELVSEGQPFDQAIKTALAQLKGKSIAVSTDVGSRSFLNLAFKRGGLAQTDVNQVIVTDVKTVELAVSRKTLCASPGGAPLTVTLAGKGFKWIVTSRDLVDFATASVDSEELLGIGSAGWGSRSDWLEKNHDTALRMLSVLYRILDFIRSEPNEALRVQVPFLNSIAGTSLTTDQAKVIVRELDPFYTFDDQRKFFVDKSAPQYYAYRFGAQLKQLEAKGILPKGKFKPDDGILAAQFYQEMMNLRSETGTLLGQAKELMAKATGQSEGMKTAQTYLAQAHRYAAARNYLDAKRFAAAAVEWARWASK